MRVLLRLLPLFVLLTACGGKNGFEGFRSDPPSEPPPVATPEAQAEQYVLDLALLQLMLLKEPAEEAGAAAHLKAANAYAAAHKKDRKYPRATLLALEYETKGNDKRQVLLVPLDTTGPKKFANLHRISAPFSAIGHTLHDIRIIKARVIPASLKKSETDELLPQIRRLQGRMTAGAQELPPPDEARLQLGLVQFFMDRGLRDAAYLAMENAKEAVAAMEAKMPQEAENTAALSKEAAALEETLHRELPYKL